MKKTKKKVATTTEKKEEKLLKQLEEENKQLLEELGQLRMTELVNNKIAFRTHLLNQLSLIRQDQRDLKSTLEEADIEANDDEEEEEEE